MMQRARMIVRAFAILVQSTIYHLSLLKCPPCLPTRKGWHHWYWAPPDSNKKICNNAYILNISPADTQVAAMDLHNVFHQVQLSMVV